LGKSFPGDDEQVSEMKRTGTVVQKEDQSRLQTPLKGVKWLQHLLFSPAAVQYLYRYSRSTTKWLKLPADHSLRVVLNLNC
jgi:hypothetical protein